MKKEKEFNLSEKKSYVWFDSKGKGIICKSEEDVKEFITKLEERSDKAGNLNMSDVRELAGDLK